MKPLLFPYQSAAYSFFLHQRLVVINSTAHQLKPQVALLDLSEEETLSLDSPLGALVRQAKALSAKVCGLSGSKKEDAKSASTLFGNMVHKEIQMYSHYHHRHHFERLFTCLHVLAS